MFEYLWGALTGLIVGILLMDRAQRWTERKQSELARARAQMLNGRRILVLDGQGYLLRDEPDDDQPVVH